MYLKTGPAQPLVQFCTWSSSGQNGHGESVPAGRRDLQGHVQHLIGSLFTAEGLERLVLIPEGFAPQWWGYST